MKNRKLFAILTLIAFMMTLLPVAAFAAPNKDASRLSVDKTKIEADGQKEAEFTVYVRNSKNIDEPAPIYIASERGLNTDSVYVKNDSKKWEKVSQNDTIGDLKVEVDNNVIKLEGKSGKKVSEYKFRVRSYIAGDAKIAVGLKNYTNTKGIKVDPYTYLTDSDVTASDAEIIGTKTITFEASKTDIIALTGVETRSGGDAQFDAYSYEASFKYIESDEKIGEATIKANKALSSEEISKINNYNKTVEDNVKIAIKDAKEVKVDYSYKIIEGDLKDKIDAESIREYANLEKVKKIVLNENVKANGSDYYELTFRVLNKSNAPVEDEKVEFSVNKSKVRLNKDDARTDEVGEVDVRVYADKHGKYEVQAKKGSETLKVEVEFAPSTIDSFEIVKDLDKKIAYDEEEAANFKLQLKDSNGNDYDLSERADAIKLVADENIMFEWVTLPNDSDLEDEDFRDEAREAYSNYDKDVNPDLVSDDVKYIYEDNGLLQIKLPELDEEGKYALKVSLDTGKSHTFEFEAKEQGEIVELTLEYDEPTLALGATSKKPTVKRVDADGVKLDAKDNLEWSVSDYTLLAEGYDADDIKEAKGAIKASSDDDYTGELVVTVIDTKEDLTASTTITIADAAVGMELVPQEEVFAVGEEGLVDLVIKDRKGNQVSLGNSAKDLFFDYYVTSKPEGAQVSAEEGQQFSKGVKEKGKATVKVYGNKEGEVKITMVISYKENDKQRKLSETVTVNFGEKKEVKTIGAKNVTLFINGTGYVVDGAAKVTDVAPFIQDNRTFVPVRIVAEALGCENEDTMWDPATQTVTLEREDLTITMTIGSNILTVSTGETVVSDVAPFIKDGRTVLPFRAIAEAFGADVEAIFAADGSVTGVTFEQE